MSHQCVDFAGNRNISLTTGKRVKLTGQELEDYKKRKVEKDKIKDETLDDIDLESSSDEEMETTSTKPATNLKPVKHDIIMRVRIKIKQG